MIVYVITTCCDAVAEQLCGVSDSGVVLEPPRLAGMSAATLERSGRGACAGVGAPAVITILSDGAAARDASVGLSVPHAATNVSAATDRATEYLIANLSNDGGTCGANGMYERQRHSSYVGSRGGLRETRGFADRPRSRGAFVGTDFGSNDRAVLGQRLGVQPVGVSIGGALAQ